MTAKQTGGETSDAAIISLADGRLKGRTSTRAQAGLRIADELRKSRFSLAIRRDLWYHAFMETMNITTNPAEIVMVPWAEYDAMKAYIAELESKLNWLTEQVRLSQVRRFGASSEAAG